MAVAEGYGKQGQSYDVSTRSIAVQMMVWRNLVSTIVLCT
jgi:hypothetical protein